MMFPVHSGRKPRMRKCFGIWKMMILLGEYQVHPSGIFTGYSQLGIYVWSLGKIIRLERVTRSPVDTSVWEYRGGSLFRELPVFQGSQRANGKECVQWWYHLGAIKTPKKGTRSMYCHQLLPWRKPPLGGEENLKGRSWDPEYYQHVKVEQKKNSLQEDYLSVAEDRERRLEEGGNVKAKRRLFRRASSSREAKWEKNGDKGKVEENVLNGLIWMW